MDFIENNPALNNISREVSEIAGYLWQKGWAERNAGNISVNVSHLITDADYNSDEYPYFEMNTPHPVLSSGFFLVSGTGKRMRDLARDPLGNTLIINLDAGGNGYRVIGKDKRSTANFMPTSELPTHLGIHHMIAERGSPEKVVIHTHATELVALTQIREYCNEDKLNRLLWGMHPETIVFIPEGVGFVPYETPGTEQIASKTIETLAKHKVALWEKHGVFAIGESVFETFDMIDILAKSARIYFMVTGSGHKPEGLSREQLAVLKELANNF
jgi:rhamnulose-1-phosphate aldolase